MLALAGAAGAGLWWWQNHKPPEKSMDEIAREVFSESPDAEAFDVRPEKSEYPPDDGPGEVFELADEARRRRK